MKKKHKMTWIKSKKKRFGNNRIFYWKGIQIYEFSPRMVKNIHIQLLTSIEALYIAVRLLRKEHFDVIFVRNNIYLGLYFLLSKRINKIPIIFNYSIPVSDFTIQEVKLNLYNGSFPKIAYVIAKIQKPFYTWMLSKVDLVIVVSKWMKQELIEKGISENKILVSPLGAASSFLNSNRSSKIIRTRYNVTHTKNIIYVGTLDKIRRLDFLLRVFVIIKKRIPDTKLLIVGDGGDRVRLQELSKKWGIADDVIFTGQVPYSEVPDYIAAADVGVSPIVPISIYKISSPTKLVEYMSCKKAVVCNDIPDQKEVIHESKGGISTKYNELEFAEAIIELLHNPGKAEKMGEMGYQYVADKRNYEKLSNEIEQRFYQLIH